MSKIKRLFWDIETSPNIVTAWRTGYKLQISPDNIIQERAIICLCYKWEGQKKVHSLEWDKGDDRSLVEAFVPVLNEADELVAHNGDKFDLKWYNTRHLFHKLPPIPEAKTVDTLAIARRRFYLNSNRLDYIAKLLGMDGKHDTSYSMWHDILLKDCPKSMKRMVSYCKQDVALLEKVYAALSQYHNPKSHAGVHDGLDKWSCAHCGSADVIKNKKRITARGTVQHGMQCKDCGRYYTISDKAFRDYCAAKA